jgi:hypothetical protein
MHHLSPDTFVDLLDGTLAESAVPHLTSCPTCQQQLAELRMAWQAAAHADVPEPSPLVWEHLSSRVRDAVAAEPDVRPSPWWRIDWSWRLAGVAGAAAAAVALIVVLQGPRVAPVEVGTDQPDVVASSGPAAAQVVEPLLDDASLGFVADLAGNLDWDAVSELGFVAYGGADRAVADMNDAERVELQRLLNEALGGGV